uniref:Uncharacterized protein n=1 Tax=Myoviridae sp. ct9Uc11 TaxID=2825042 RepID=A0A8S5U991_9CAUD|nr:MAG TPA: hypothetical protein [Myoviridae sp. ct9Uc11]
MSAERPGKVRRAAAVPADGGADRKQRGMRRLPGDSCERAGGDAAWALCR